MSEQTMKDPTPFTDPPDWRFACGCVEHGRGGKTICERHAKWFAEAAGASVPQEAANDVCRSCGHYRETHHNDVYPHSLLQRCDGWMPAPAPACRCKQFVPRLTGEASSTPEGER